MISGASDEELEIANARMDIMLATNYTPDNPGPLAIIDKYYDKEIDRLNNIIEELESYLLDYDESKVIISSKGVYYKNIDILDKLKELKENK